MGRAGRVPALIATAGWVILLAMFLIDAQVTPILRCYTSFCLTQWDLVAGAVYVIAFPATMVAALTAAFIAARSGAWALAVGLLLVTAVSLFGGGMLETSNTFDYSVGLTLPQGAHATATSFALQTIGLVSFIMPCLVILAPTLKRARPPRVGIALIWLGAAGILLAYFFRWDHGLRSPNPSAVTWLLGLYLALWLAGVVWMLVALLLSARPKASATTGTGDAAPPRPAP